MNRRVILQGLIQLPILQAAQRAQERPKPAGPAALSAVQFATVRALCDAIIPGGGGLGGAVEAGAPELIDLLASENPDYKARLTKGLEWLDSFCRGRFRAGYLECAAAQRTEVLDLIAFRENAQKAAGLDEGIAFFAFLRDLTMAGFFTSEIGMKYLGYRGNHFNEGFPGCPALPE